MGAARPLEQLGSLLLPAPGGSAGAALGKLMPSDRPEPKPFAQVREAIAIAPQQLALRPVLQPANRSNDEMHARSSATHPGRVSRHGGAPTAPTRGRGTPRAGPHHPPRAPRG